MDFFRRGSVAGKSSSEKDDQSLVSIQAALNASQLEEKKQRDRCQKLELEKSLLQNFVDKVYETSDEGTPSTMEAMKSYTSELQSTNVDLESRLLAASIDVNDLRQKLLQSTKRSEAFEAALSRVNDELKQADVSLQAQAASSTDRQDLNAQIAALSRQLTERDTTIAELMSRIASSSREHKKTLADYEAILSKSSDAHNSAVDELSLKTESLTVANAELEDLRLKVAASENAHGASDALTAGFKHATGLIEGLLAEWNEYFEILSTSFVDRTHTIADALFGASIAALLESRSTSSAALAVARDQLSVAGERLQMKEARITEARAFLAQSEERCHAAETEISQLNIRIQEAGTRTDALESRTKVLECELSDLTVAHEQLQRDCEAVTETLAAEQKHSALKIRQSGQIIKELQEQLVGRPQGEHNISQTPGPSGDVSTLLDRIAEMQERLWLLESAKTSYEEEMDRMSKDLQQKSIIIRTHFQAAAERAAKEKGRLGLFKPTQVEVQAQAQIMLEQTLTANLQLESQVRELAGRLRDAEHQLELAEEDGFYIERGQTEEEHDVFS